MFYLWPSGCFIPNELMKANVILTYSDDSKICFEFKCDKSSNDALELLKVVCRGALMASMAYKVTAYNEDGFDVFSYFMCYEGI